MVWFNGFDSFENIEKRRENNEGSVNDSTSQRIFLDLEPPFSESKSPRRSIPFIDFKNKIIY